MGTSLNQAPRRRLGRDFFRRPTLKVARDLVGRHLVRILDGRRLVGRIVEVEAYVGAGDTACHGRSGRTRRNEILFGASGSAYVYLVYGLHHLLNVVTEKEGFPAAVLLRALEPQEGIEIMRRLRAAAGRGRQPGAVAARGRQAAGWIAGGPGRLCQALAVDLELNGEKVTGSKELFIEAGEGLPARRIASGPRVGIDYAEKKDREAPWRFWERDSPYVSRAG